MAGRSGRRAKRWVGDARSEEAGAVPDYAVKTLTAPRGKAQVRAVRGHIHACLRAGLPSIGLFTVPNSVKPSPRSSSRFKLTPHRADAENTPLWWYYNRSLSGRAGGCCHSVHNGNKVLPKSAGRLRTCPRPWAAAPLCAHSYECIFHLRGLRRILGQREREPLCDDGARRQKYQRPAGTAPRQPPPVAPERVRRGASRPDLRIRGAGWITLATTSKG